MRTVKEQMVEDYLPMYIHRYLRYWGGDDSAEAVAAILDDPEQKDQYLAKFGLIIGRGFE